MLDTAIENSHKLAEYYKEMGYNWPSYVHILEWMCPKSYVK